MAKHKKATAPEPEQRPWGPEQYAAYRAQEITRRVNSIVRCVAELPDRTSPDDQPDMMLVTAAELEAIIRYNLSY